MLLPQDKVSNSTLLSRYSVVLTTYGTMAQEAPAKEKQNVKIKKQVRCVTAKAEPCMLGPMVIMMQNHTINGLLYSS